MLRFLAPLLIVGCTAPSRGVAVDRIVPDRGDVGVGQPVTIEGTFLAVTSNIDNGQTDTALVTASIDQMPLADATWLTQNTIMTTMPGLPEGTYDVTVSIDGRTDTLTGGYIVGMPGGGDGGVMTGPATHSITVVGPVTAGPLADFPLLVHLVDARLRTTAAGGEVANASGFDIFFSLDQAGSMRLSHEIETYVGASGELVAWVKIPSLHPDTTFFIHVGDPAVTTSQEDVPGVWTASFGAVYHLSDGTDSTANTNTGVETATTGVPGGQIDTARAFNGTNSRITVQPATSVNNIFEGTGGTVAAWVFVDSAGQSSLGRVFEKATIARIGSCDGGGGGVNSLFFTHEFTGNPGTWCTPTNSLGVGVWSHVAVAYSKSSTANQPTIYINGVAQNTTQIEIPSGTAFSDAVGPLVIGDRAAGARAFDGVIDELSYSRTLRTYGWIKTSFDNQQNPRNFVMLGP